MSAKGATVKVTLPDHLSLPSQPKPGNLSETSFVGPARIRSARDTWSTIFADDFESGFPGDWTLLNNGASSASWGTWTCWAGDSPTHSVGCAAGGSGPISCGQVYPNDMSVWMIYGPFSLADPNYTAAELRFNYRLDSEQDYDYFNVLASTNGTNFFGVNTSGTDAPQASVLDLAAVPSQSGTQNLLGQSQVWIGFLFTSDESVAAANGAQVDDVEVVVASAVSNQAPQVSVTSPNGGESWQAGSTHAITYTASDPDSGPSAITIALDYSTNGGSSWTAIASSQSNTGSYQWTVPSVATSSARVRVRASDSLDEGSDTSNANFTITQVPAGSNTLTVGSGSGTVGSSLSVSLALANENVVKGLQIDLVYNSSVAVFQGLTATGRGAGMAASSQVISSGLARILLYHDDASTIAAGTGTIANLVFALVGQNVGQTAVTPGDIILSDADGLALDCDGVAGNLSATAAISPPGVQVIALKNPGRVHSLQIIVNVTAGSGGAPSVTAGGTAVSMTALGDGAWLGTYAASAEATSVTVAANDTNANGQGSDQITIAFE